MSSLPWNGCPVLPEYAYLVGANKYIGFSSSEPVLVATGVTQISAGQDHYLFLKRDGTVYSMGRNYQGMLGDGSSVDSPTLKQVYKLNNVVSVAAGSAQSTAITSSGAVYAWGWHNCIGTGTSNQSYTPVVIDALAGIKMIKAMRGQQQILVMDANNRVYGWGGNAYGMLGDGIGKETHSPKLIATILPVAPDTKQNSSHDDNGHGNDAGCYDASNPGKSTGCNKPQPVTSVSAPAGTLKVSYDAKGNMKVSNDR